MRPLLAVERELLDSLLQAPFPGRDAIADQLAHALARQIDEDGSLELFVTGAPAAETVSRVPAEAAVEDVDGVTVHVLLHVVDGYARELEVFREDSAPVKAPLRLDALRVTVNEGAAAGTGTIEFADSVRIVATPETIAAGYADRLGTCYGFTTPSVTGVPVIGPGLELDLALNVAFSDDTSAWFEPSVVAFVHVSARQVAGTGDRRLIRDATGAWVESPDAHIGRRRAFRVVRALILIAIGIAAFFVLVEVFGMGEEQAAFAAFFAVLFALLTAERG